jgi:Peptidase family M48
VRLSSYTALLVFILTKTCIPQSVNDRMIPDGLVNGMRGIELSRRIFETERDMMHRIRMYSPIVETYIQSLWPDTTAQMPLDDVYFLGKVNFHRYLASADDSKAMLFGSSKSSRKILNDNGQRWELYPDGFVSMLFVDVQDFDADTYRLTYLRPAALGTVSCLMFAVTPVKVTAPGRFNGTVWVESTALRIIRVEGTFQPHRLRLGQRLRPFGGYVGLFLHFDCWREMITPDLWVPAYVTVDDNIGWKEIGGEGTTDVHYRGRTFVWGYSYLGSFENRQLAFADAASDSGSEITDLEKDGLVVPFGRVERSLNTIIEGMSAASHLNLPKVTCRILATTPVEMFHVGNTILVSRGLLELVPDESTLAVFLAHELAHVVLDTANGKRADRRSVFAKYNPPGEFPGLGIAHAEEEGGTSALTCGILNGSSAYASATGGAAGFVEELNTMSQQIPNLTRARFGVGLVENGRAVHEITSCRSSGQPAPHQVPPQLQLRGRYLVGVSTGELRLTP